MSRIVKRTATEPAAVIIDGKEKWLCRCGLSQNQPYCNGSHALAGSEEPGKLYWYDEDGGRHDAPGEFPGMRAW